MSIEDFAHMWDGSDDGWTLHYFDRKAWRITVRFPQGRPAIHDVAKLREFDDDLQNIPTSKIWEQLRDLPSYSLASEFSNVDIHTKMKRGKELGLNCDCICIDHSGYLAVHANGSAMIIEDDEEAGQVTQRMLDAGVPVVQTHVD